MDGKKNAKIIAFTLVIAFVLSAGIASALSNSGGGEWKYNKVTAIKENSGKALTDYQVSIELKGSDFPEEAKSDGCDIRFSDPGGKELSYWIDEFDPSTRTYEIWVKVSEIPASGTVTVLMYYGNPSAGVVSDGDATFVFFDDFETPVYQEEDGWCDSYSHTRIGTTWQQQNVYCDYVFITKYADPEPIATIGIETNVNAVSDCVVIKSPGYYELAEDIMNCTTKHCITITASDVVLDGAGHTIDGGYANASIERFCIYVKNSSTALSNVTVKNLNVTGWNTGIYFYRVKNSRIENNQVNNNKNGIYLVYSNHISLTNNTVYNNSVHGINLVVLHDNTLTNNIINSNNIIYNNIFNNVNNAYISASYTIWNTTKTPGTNIGGGGFLGGNAWLKPDGTGHSQTCNDSDYDGICDKKYKINLINIDYLPLKVVNVGTCMNITSTGYYKLINDIYSSAPCYITITASGVIFDGNGHKIENSGRAGYSGHGICVYNTSTTLSNIIIKNVNVRFWESGILLERVEESVIENNTAYSNGKGIKLLRSSNNSITKNSISRSSIYLMDSTNNCITNNNASQSSIYLERSNHNTITKNNVCNNGNPGISLYSSNNNLIYLNNFIDNSYSIGSSYSSNTFNSTNPIPYNYHIVEITGYMGNYWSDYNDIDTNGDGIWDNPYIISLDNDNYPLVEPFELYFTD